MNKIRFLQDDGSSYPEWEQVSLGEAASWINGFPFKPHQLSNTGTSVIKIKELLDPSDLSVKTTTLGIPEHYHINDGDLIFSWSMTLATRIWKNGFSYLNQHLYKVVPNENYNKIFLRYLLENEIPNLQILMHGGTAKHITRKDLIPHKISIPSLSEQEKIANFFTALDENIDAHELKLELLKQQKQGYMQQVFSRKLRFHDDNGNTYGDWEETTLNSTGKIITGLTPDKSNSTYWIEGTVDWVGPSDITYNKYVQNTINKLSKAGYENSRKIPKKSLLVTCIGSTIGKMAININEASCNQQLNVIIPNSSTCVDYLYYYLSYNVECIRIKAGKTAVPIINKTEFSRTPILLPSIEEQNKIALMFSTLDENISAITHKIELLKEQKQGYMQRMF